MLIVAERINATRKPVAEALRRRDAAFIQQEARRQAEVGADYIDVNAAVSPNEERSVPPCTSRVAGRRDRVGKDIRVAP